MPGSKRLSQRLGKPVGLNEFNVLGRTFADLPISALNGRGPIAATILDFGAIPVPNATAFATLNWTVTDVNTSTSPTIVGNSSDGYLLINPGTKADSGYNLQANVANVIPRDLMQFTSGPNTTLAAGRDIWWGMRFALQSNSTSAWDGKMFAGLAVTDTALMTNTTGALDSLANGIGVHIGETGVIRFVAMRGSAATNLTLTQTPTTLAGTALSTTFQNDDFHDFTFHAHWNAAAGTTGTDYVICYLDGVRVGTISGNSILPDLTSVSLYNSIEFENGPTQLSDLAVGYIVNATKRLYQTQI